MFAELINASRILRVEISVRNRVHLTSSLSMVHNPSLPCWIIHILLCGGFLIYQRAYGTHQQHMRAVRLVDL
jgi:hypothetical protein